MRIEIEADEEKIKEAVIAKMADSIYWELISRDGLKKKIMDSINWSKMTPIVQEQILKMAAEKAFK